MAAIAATVFPVSKMIKRKFLAAGIIIASVGATVVGCQPEKQVNDAGSAPKPTYVMVPAQNSTKK